MLAKFFNKTQTETQQPQPSHSSPAPDGNKPKVLMYSTTWCGSCRAAKRYFADKGIEYDEIDIESVPGAAEKVMAWANGNKTVPTLVIGNEVVVDWHRKLVEQALISEGLL